MAPDRYRYFRPEARELLDQFAEAILALEKDPAQGAHLQRLLRLAHTLKGAARVVRQPEIAEGAHAIEAVLAPFREVPGGGVNAVSREAIDGVLGHLQAINAHLLALALAAEPAAQKAAPDEGPRGEEPALPDDSLRFVRADVTEMDVLLEGVSETHALLGGLRAATQGAEQARHLADLLVEQLGARRTGEAARPLGNAGATQAMAAELRKYLGGLERSLGSALDQMDRELHQLREGVEQLRLVSVGTLFTVLERTARDGARAQGNKIHFEAQGGDIRLDAYVLGTIQGALVQIVRNAVAHGIEAADDRRAAGKAAAGRITIAVSRRAQRIRFECRDDGRGLDLAAVRRVALQRGLVDAAGVTDTDALVRLLLRGGISTSDTVTEMAGRGIGLDVVRTAVDRLGGEVVVRTEAGRGTTVELVVPLSLASMDALVVEAGADTVVIPLDAVQGSIRIAAGQIALGATSASVIHDGAAIPFLPLARALRGTRPPADRNWTAVIVTSAGGMAAVGVDRMAGVARVVIRPLPDLVPASPIVAGALLDAEGNPRLVLDPDGLVAEAQRGEGAALAPLPVRRPVLVIDDSLTTRMLEQTILESAGYEVDTATSGEEGLERARSRSYALFLVDVEMPGIDGFTFVERTRADPALRDVPAILVTSRAAPEDRQRGRDVGAQGYIIKSEFNQSELLTMIRPLMS